MESEKRPVNAWHSSIGDLMNLEENESKSLNVNNIDGDLKENENSDVKKCLREGCNFLSHPEMKHG